MSDWYYRSGGRDIGPMSSSELLQRIRSGHIKPETPIRKDDSQWVPAADVNGLFDAAARPVQRQVCPYCNHPVSATPPTECGGCQRYLTRVVTKTSASTVNAKGEWIGKGGRSAPTNGAPAKSPGKSASSPKGQEPATDTPSHAGTPEKKTSWVRRLFGG